MADPGLFVVVEGPEGSGKSTLIRALAARMATAGQEPVVVREPGGTALAESVRQTLLEVDHEVAPVAELFLFLAARADLTVQVLRPALARGQVVLADRFTLSTEVYQVVGRGVDGALVAAGNAAATGGLRPDLTLVLDLPPGVGRGRQEAAGKALDRLDRESSEFHDRICRAYVAVTGPGVVHLDGTGSPEQLLEAAWTAVRTVRPDLWRQS
ncbi:MAG: dTMP kinase [Gemmatimonadales bacterium]|jgi:dTMP kinase|nr:MAG: dTMP kinase [Gemmatimonadales bacterium]